MLSTYENGLEFKKCVRFRCYPENNMDPENLYINTNLNSRIIQDPNLIMKNTSWIRVYRYELEFHHHTKSKSYSAKYIESGYLYIDTVLNSTI